MTVFITSQRRGGKVLTFTRKPAVHKAAIGYVIDAYCDDESLFGGSYITTVGYADDIGRGSKVGFRRRSDARAAMAEGIRLGILHN